MEKNDILERLEKVEQNGLAAYTAESIRKHFPEPMLYSFNTWFSIGDLVTIDGKKSVWDWAVNKFLDEYLKEIEKEYIY